MRTITAGIVLLSLIGCTQLKSLIDPLFNEQRTIEISVVDLSPGVYEIFVMRDGTRILTESWACGMQESEVICKKMVSLPQ